MAGAVLVMFIPEKEKLAKLSVLSTTFLTS